MLRGMLDFFAGEDGIDPRDDETIDYIMRARGVDAKEQYEKLFELCTLVVGLLPDPDPDFGSSGSPSGHWYAVGSGKRASGATQLEVNRTD